jgi:hypothetical protein
MSGLIKTYQIDEPITIPAGAVVALRERTGGYWTIEAAIIKDGNTQFTPPANMRDALLTAAGIDR